jgi:hypothetical protein
MNTCHRAASGSARAVTRFVCPRGSGVARAGLIIAIVLIAACSSPPRDRFDLADQPPADAVLSQLREARALLLGSVQVEFGRDGASGGDSFGRVRGLALDSAGRIFVADELNHEIRVFSGEGRLLFRFGGRGSGPGELLLPCCLAWSPEHVLWVRDSGNGRFNLYHVGESGAEYVRSVETAAGSGPFVVPLSFVEDGVVDVTTMWGPLGPEQVRILIDSAGRARDRLRIGAPPPHRLPHVRTDQRGGGRIASGVYFPLFGPRHVVAHSPAGEWAEVITSRYAILWYSASDRLLRVIRRDVASRELTADERTRESESWQRLRQLDPGAVRRGSLPQTRWKPPIRTIAFDQQGRLWVHLSDPTNDMCSADVIGRGGSYDASVSWPCRADIAEGVMTGDLAIGVSRGRLDQELVTVIRFAAAVH